MTWRWLNPFACRHKTRFRERKNRVLMLTCERCGDSVPAIARTSKELRSVLRHKPASERMKAKRESDPSVVVPMPRRSQP